MSSGEEKGRYIEEVGLALESLGLPRMLGRILGALLVADPPEMSADQLATTLRASLGTISVSTRALEDLDLIERLRKPGDRKAYFRLRPGSWHRLAQERADAFVKALGVAERGLRVLDSDKPEVRRSLEEMLDFMQFIENEYSTLLARWERKLAEQGRS